MNIFEGSRRISKFFGGAIAIAFLSYMVFGISYQKQRDPINLAGTKDIILSFSDGTTHIFKNAPIDVTSDEAKQRGMKELKKEVTSIELGRNNSPCEFDFEHAVVDRMVICYPKVVDIRLQDESIIRNVPVRTSVPDLILQLSKHGRTILTSETDFEKIDVKSFYFVTHVEEIYNALIKADAAGNTEDAKRLADYIRENITDPDGISDDASKYLLGTPIIQQSKDKTKNAIGSILLNNEYYLKSDDSNKRAIFSLFVEKLNDYKTANEPTQKAIRDRFGVKEKGQIREVIDLAAWVVIRQLEIDYAQWIVKNAEKKGSPQFNFIAGLYQDAKKGYFDTKKFDISSAKLVNPELDIDYEKLAKEFGGVTNATNIESNNPYLFILTKSDSVASDYDLVKLFRSSKAIDLVKQEYWDHLKQQLSPPFIGLVLSLVSLWIFTWVVGWIARGFMGIPMGLDKRVDT